MALSFTGRPIRPSCDHFFSLFSDPYLAHRLAGLLTLLAGVGAIGWYLRRCGVRGGVAFVVGAIAFSLNAGSYSIQARPDFLVFLEIVLLLILGQAIARERHPSVRAGLLLGLLGLAAYLTKPYAVFPWGSVVLYLVIVRRWRAAVPLVVSGVVIGVGLAAYARLNPYFVFDTLTFQVTQSALNAPWLWLQLGDFSLLACGLVLVALFTSRRRASAARLDYWAYSTGLAVVPLVGYLGWHMGAYLTYFFQLLVPPLAILVGLRFEAALRRGAGAWTAVALLINCVVLGVCAPGLPHADPTWDALSSDIHAQAGPILADWLLEPFSRTRDDLTLMGNGITPLVLEFPSLVPLTPGVDASARSEVSQFQHDLRQRLVGSTKPAALYLEGIVQAMTPAQEAFVGRNQPDLLLIPFLKGKDRFVFIPRTHLGYLRKEVLAQFEPVAFFDLRPYYFATNERRQGAGTWGTTVVKLIRYR